MYSDKTARERVAELHPILEAQARAEYQNAAEAYANPPADWDRDDIKWAYEAMIRAQLKLRSYDVV